MAAILQPTDNFDVLLDTLPAGWENLAHETHVVSPRADATIKDARFLMRAMMVHVGCDLPLRQTVATLAEAGLQEVSHVSLHRRLKAAGGFLQTLVSRMARERSDATVEHWGGYVPVMVDGSVVVTPKYNEFNGRLHAALRLADLSIVDALITTAESGETLKRFSFSPNELIVADRGFADPVGISSVLAQGADVLVRVNRSSLPVYDADHCRIDLLAWVRALATRERVHARPARAEGPTHAIDGRLLAVRVPKDKRAEARKRARAEFGNDPVALELSEWVLLFTTASAARLTDAQAVRLYRCRWQIELLFKRMKSLANLSALPNYRPETVVSWLALKLILFMCVEHLAQPPVDAGFPPLRATQWTRARQTALEADDDPLATPHRYAPPHIAA
jgi:hypothetical protein